MAATLIPVTEIPTYVKKFSKREITLVTVYNWIKNGYHGTTLPVREVSTSRDKGRAKVLATTTESIKKFLGFRYAEKN
jgi:hypothetical protein